MPRTLLEDGGECAECVNRRCRLHLVQAQILHKLYHDAETQWGIHTGQVCNWGFNHSVMWKDRALFAKAHCLLTIALRARKLHTNIFFPGDLDYGRNLDDGHRMAEIRIGQARREYEAAGMNGKAFLPVTQDYEVTMILVQALQEQVTADTIEDNDFDYVLQLPSFETYEEAPSGTEGSIFRDPRLPPPKHWTEVEW